MKNLIVIVLALCLGASAQAATIAVNTLIDVSANNDGLCSLREAVLAAETDSVGATDCVAQGAFASRDTISLASLSGTLTLDAPRILIQEELELVGPGAGSLTLRNPLGIPVNRLLEVATGAALVVTDLTISDGRPAILQQANSSLRVERVHFIGNGNSTVGNGGALLSDGALEVVDSYFEGNAASSGGAIAVFGGQAVIASSTFVNNEASLAGGALRGFEGFIDIENSTFSGNEAGTSGAALRFGSLQGSQTVSVEFSTVSANTGAAQIVASDNASVNISRSILAAGSNNCNTASGASILIDSDSIDDAGSCGGTASQQQNPLLDSPGNYGGPVPTLRLQSGSPAIDRAADCGGIAVDARGEPRPAEGGNGPPGGCDVGAFEVQSGDANIFANLSGLSGTGLTIALNGGSPQPVFVNGLTFLGTVPVGASYSVTTDGQPTGPVQTCTVASGSGTAAAADILVPINCLTDTFTVGGTVSGLSGSGLVLQNNAGDDLVITSNGAFTFPTPIPDFGPYVVTVAAQPSNPQQFCTVSDGTGTVNGGPINTVSASCRNVVDLSITKDDGLEVFVAGEPLTYLITVVNNGMTDVVGARVRDIIPATLSNASWSCTPGSGAACNANGTGSIDELVDLDGGSTLIFTLTSATSATSSASVVNVAEVFAPASVIDLDLADNIAEDTSRPGGIFRDGFEQEVNTIMRAIENLLR